MPYDYIEAACAEKKTRETASVRRRYSAASMRLMAGARGRVAVSLVVRRLPLTGSKDAAQPPPKRWSLALKLRGHRRQRHTEPRPVW